MQTQETMATVRPADDSKEITKEEIEPGIAPSLDVEQGKVIGDAPAEKGNNNMLFIIAGIVAAVIVIVVVVVILVVVVFDDGGDNSSVTSSAEAGSALSSVRVNMVNTNTASRRSRRTMLENLQHSLSKKLRRAHDSEGTNYTTFVTPTETDVPGAKTLSTVNTIICFIASTGLTVMDPVSAPYEALVDMAPCESGQRSSQKKMYAVTVGGPDDGKPSVITTESEFTIEGYVWFNLNSEDVQLKGEARLTLITKPIGTTCEGNKLEGAKEGYHWCWTGGVFYHEEGILDGYFEGAYDSESSPTTPARISFYENNYPQAETVSLLYMSSADESIVKTKAFDGTNYYCLNADSNSAKVTKGNDASTVCESSASICLSKTNIVKYPFGFTPFDSTTGALAGVEGDVYSLQLKYFKNSKECWAGLQQHSYMSCGHGQPQPADLIDEGGVATSNDGTAYSLHHSNSQVQKYQVKALSMAEFSSAYFISHGDYDAVDAKYYQYILQYNNNNYVFKVAYKRYWKFNVNEWSDFVADGSTTYTFSSGKYGVSPCWKDAKYYTGELKPVGWFTQFKYSHDQWVYATDDSTVFMQVELGLLQPVADLSLICPQYCKNKDDNSGFCHESQKCPKQSWDGLTLGSSGNTEYTYSSDNAYMYKWQQSDVTLYTYTDNSGATIAKTAIDAWTNVNYDSNNQWNQASHTEMFPGTDASAFNTAAKVDAYKQVDGNVFYKVQVGMKGGYAGYSFYAKTGGAFVKLADPLRCDITMSAAYDANGGTEYNGAKFSLAFYGHYTHGLTFQQIKLGNAAVGEYEEYVASPQIANGAVCGDYVLKSQYTMEVPTELAASECGSISMSDPGTLPLSAIAPNHKNDPSPVTDKLCYANNKVETDVDGCRALE
jgi:hypothetical protein